MASGSRVDARIRGVAQIAAMVAALWVSPVLADGASADGSLTLVLDQAKLVKLPERAATIVIGNPLIADAALQPGGLMVMTGKGYGTTNLIALDSKGNALFEKRVQVNGPALNTIVVYKGVNRETYSCAPTCQPRITLGDGQQFFAQTLTQTTTRNSQATSMSSK
jgi:Flp pilus assembly secretin CpaC